MKQQILVIDDNPDILDALELVLAEFGYEVQLDQNAAIMNRLDAIKGHTPHLIILDVLLSGKDGRILAKTLKAHPNTKHIPILMISAHPSAGHTVREYGADDFLPKPFGIDELLEKVQKHTGATH